MKTSQAERERRSNLMKKLWKDQNFREAHLIAMRSLELRIVRSKQWKGKRKTKLQKEKMSLSADRRWTSLKERERARANGKKQWTSEYRKMMIEQSTKLWKDPAYVKKTLSAVWRKPNKAEEKLKSLLSSSFRYGVSVEGFVPDFIDEEKHLIIELFGDYWHSLPGRPEEDKRRIRSLKSQGYKVLVVWEHELENLESLNKKLEIFERKRS